LVCSLHLVCTIRLIIEGQVYYFNTRTKEVKYGCPDGDEFDKPGDSAEEALVGKRSEYVQTAVILGGGGVCCLIRLHK
jgi:hypothetical protein